MPFWTNSGRGVYVDHLIENFQPKIRNADQVSTGVRVYRSALAKARDRSVTIAAIGHVTNLLHVLWYFDQQ